MMLGGLGTLCITHVRLIMLYLCTYKSGDPRISTVGSEGIGYEGFQYLHRENLNFVSSRKKNFAIFLKDGQLGY